jgi:hypothetical protein
MTLSAAELAALQDIESRLSDGGQPSLTGRWWVLVVVLLTGASTLVVGGLVAGNPAAVVLGVAWGLAAPVVWWAQRHLVVVALDDTGGC